MTLDRGRDSETPTDSRSAAGGSLNGASELLGSPDRSGSLQRWQSGGSAINFGPVKIGGLIGRGLKISGSGYSRVPKVYIHIPFHLYYTWGIH